MQNAIDRMLSEAQRARFQERRTEARHPFVRPVRITVGSATSYLAFSKNLSKQGIGLITDQEWEPGLIAVLTIHSTTGDKVHLKCEARWSDPFGHNWWLSGWKFLSVSSPPSSLPLLCPAAI